MAWYYWVIGGLSLVIILIIGLGYLWIRGTLEFLTGQVRGIKVDKS